MKRFAIVNRTKADDVADLGARCFDGSFAMSSDAEIISYYTIKMYNDGYKDGEFEIELFWGYIDPETGAICHS